MAADISGASNNLGDRHGPMLVFGGPYSNLQAIQAMQQVAREQGIAPDNIVCTGDLVAYCADAQATSDAIRQWGIHVVQGNCEQALADAADDCGCGFASGSACSLLSVAWYRHARQHIDAETCDWMAHLPKTLRFTLGGRRFYCMHGSPRSNNEFVFASTPYAHKRELLADIADDVVIGGHCGLPFASTVGAQWWLNAGVIGLPANDGNAHTWYILLTPTEKGVQVSWHHLHYDVAEAQGAMQDAGLPDAYRMALADGLWPSMDVLPEREKAQRGQMLNLPAVDV